MLAVIGCGNPNRCDDGVGPAVIRALRDRAAWGETTGVKLLDVGTDGMAAMFAARSCRSLIVVDACRSGSPPGAIFEAPGSEFAADYAPSLNLHDFRWENALYAGRMMFHEAFPSDVTVLLIEAATVDFGIELSPSVSAAATKVVARIERLIEARLAAGRSAA